MRIPLSGPEICVLSNPRSGTSLRNPGAVDRAMRVFGPRAQLRAFSGDPADEATRALQNGFRIIVAVGGDGSVSGVAPALAGSDTPLAILPMGTFNYCARGLGMSEGAAQAILDGSADDIAVGTMNGRVVLNVPIGLYPAILEEREATYSRFCGWPES